MSFTAPWLKFASTKPDYCSVSVSEPHAIGLTARVRFVSSTPQARDSNSQAIAGGLQSLCWGSAAVGGIVSAYFSGALLERMGTRDVFSLTALLPLLITGCALLVDEKRRNDAHGG